MSEFTSGCLVLNNDTSKRALINKAEVQKTYQLNDNWIVFLSSDTYINEDFPKSILEISTEIPILYFYNFEDHCWGFKIISNRNEITSFELSYEIKDNMVINLAQERFPDEDIIEFLYIDENGGKIREEIEREIESEYWGVVREQYSSLDIEKFKLFHLSDESIETLKMIMNVEYLQKLELPHDLVDEFKKAIGFPEMSWISIDGIEDLDDRLESI